MGSYKSVSVVLLSAFVVLVAVSLSPAQTVFLDHVDGLNENGYIPEGGVITFYIRITNGAEALETICDGYDVCSDDLTWTTMSGMLNPAYCWDFTIDFCFPPFFDLGMYIYPLADGSGCDTIGFGGAAGTYGTGLPADFDDWAYAITIGPVHSGPTPGFGTLTLDSSFFPPGCSIEWPWPTETWGGPYVFEMCEGCVADPQITSTPILEAKIGELYTYDVDVQPDYPLPVTYTLTTSPEGMTIDSESGLIEWTPASAGDFDVVVQAASIDGGDTQEFTISVFEWVAPTITSIPVLEGRAGKLYTYDVEAEGYPVPMYSLALGPAGMMMDSTTGLVEWMPSAAGDYDVIVEAFNSEGTTSQSFTISVCGPNTYLEQDPIIVKDLEDRILRVYIACENIGGVDWESILVNSKIPPKEARIEGDLLVFDIGCTRFLSAWRPISGDVQGTYTVEYVADTVFKVLTGDVNIQVYPGDLDFNWVVDQRDIQIMKDYLWDRGPAPEFRELLDVNRDGQVDVRDLRELVEIVY